MGGYRVKTIYYRKKASVNKWVILCPKSLSATRQFVAMLDRTLLHTGVCLPCPSTDHQFSTHTDTSFGKAAKLCRVVTPENFKDANENIEFVSPTLTSSKLVKSPLTPLHGGG